MDHIYYVGFYSKLDNPNDFRIFPATITKMDYIISALKKADFRITVLALGEAQTKKKIVFNRKTITIDKQEKIIYVNTFGGINSLFRIVSRIWLLIQLFFFLCFEVENGSTVIYYHTFATIWAVKLSRVFNKYKLIFEVEEIFQAAWKGSIVQIEKEIKYLKKADGYILVNDLVASKCGFDVNPFVVCYGDYSSNESNLNKKKRDVNDPIKIVYAGVIGDKNSDVYLSIKTMEFLPNNYLLNILGYGKVGDIAKMKMKIIEMNKSFNFDKILYHGRLSGKKYTDFLATCQIGLSTRVLEDKYSDFTFPSKVMVYLGNNLTTVSSPISCIIKSKISDSVFFYEQSTPQSVSEKIKSINPNEFDLTNSDLLDRLNDDFVDDLTVMLNKIYI